MHFREFQLLHYNQLQSDIYDVHRPRQWNFKCTASGKEESHYFLFFLKPPNLQRVVSSSESHFFNSLEMKLRFLSVSYLWWWKLKTETSPAVMLSDVNVPTSSPTSSTFVRLLCIVLSVRVLFCNLCCKTATSWVERGTDVACCNGMYVRVCVREWERAQAWHPSFNNHINPCEMKLISAPCWSVLLRELLAAGGPVLSHHAPSAVREGGAAWSEHVWAICRDLPFQSEWTCHRCLTAGVFVFVFAPQKNITVPPVRWL